MTRPEPVTITDDAQERRDREAAQLDAVARHMARLRRAGAEGRSLGERIADVIAQRDAARAALAATLPDDEPGQPGRPFDAADLTPYIEMARTVAGEFAAQAERLTSVTLVPVDESEDVWPETEAAVPAPVPWQPSEGDRVVATLPVMTYVGQSTWTGVRAHLIEGDGPGSRYAVPAGTTFAPAPPPEPEPLPTHRGAVVESLPDERLWTCEAHGDWWSADTCATSLTARGLVDLYGREKLRPVVPS